MRSLPLIALGMAMLAAGCGGGEKSSPAADSFVIPSGYSDFHKLPDDGWRYDDTLSFTTPAASGELRVAVRHSVTYPYRNVWIEVTRTGPDSGATPVRDTVELELADPFGLWKGTGVGPTRQMEATVERGVKADSGSTVTLRHIMRLDTLPAIEQAGIFIID